MHTTPERAQQRFTNSYPGRGGSDVFVHTGGCRSGSHCSESGWSEGLALAENGCLQSGKTAARPGRPGGERPALAGGESCLLAFRKNWLLLERNNANIQSDISPQEVVVVPIKYLNF